MDKIISRPLVSVVVVTYNSSSTVLETLGSIKDQTYDNIELIITDDKSSDNTIQVCSKWLDDNKERFVYSTIVETDKNTGVSGNINRGVLKSHGKWIKSIAGDDLLIPTAIENYVDFICNNSEIKMCVCDVECFSSNSILIDKIIDNYKSYFEKESETYDQQRKRVMTELVFVGPAFFYSRELYNEIGGFTEKYDCAEEWPFVYKVIISGNRIFTIDKKLIRYRIQGGSLCNSNSKLEIPNKRVFKGMYRFYFDRPFRDLIKELRLFTAWDRALWFWSVKYKYKFKSHFVQRVLSLLFMMFSPLTYYRRIMVKRPKDVCK